MRTARILLAWVTSCALVAYLITAPRGLYNGYSVGNVHAQYSGGGGGGVPTFPLLAPN
jgi:hypothetical protein